MALQRQTGVIKVVAGATLDLLDQLRHQKRRKGGIKAGLHLGGGVNGQGGGKDEETGGRLHLRSFCCLVLEKRTCLGLKRAHVI